MKVMSVSKNNYEAPSVQTNAYPHPPKMIDAPKDSVSFSGLKSGLSGMFDAMGTNFFVQFLVVDTLSMIIPRILVGLDRDRDKTGKLNIKAAAEEAGREISSGPSMGIIPMAILAAVTAKYPAVHMSSKTMSAVSQSMNKVVDSASDVEGFKTKGNLNKKLAEEMFENAFGEMKFAKGQKAAFKKEFVNLLDEGTKLNTGLFKNKEYKKKAAAFDELVSKIYNSVIGKAPDSTREINFKLESLVDGKPKLDQTAVNSKDFFKDFHNYSKDAMGKITKSDFASKSLDEVKKVVTDKISSIQKTRGHIKFATTIGAFLAVGIFLVNLPKLYQQKGLSPAQESARRAQEEAARAQKGGANESL